MVVDQYDAPLFYVATHDGTQLRRNRIRVLPTKETPVVIRQQMQSVHEDSRTREPLETVAAEKIQSQTDRPEYIQQTEQSLRRSTRI